jgi:hypothetical protein
MALAHRADEEGDDLGAAVIDLNASYWSDQTEAARQDAASARADVAEARTEVAEAQSRLTATRDELEAARDQLGFLRSQLAEISDENRRLQDDAADAGRLREDVDRLRGEATALRVELAGTTDELGDARSRLAALEQELIEQGSIRAASASITDNSWLDLALPAYQSPVRPQAPRLDAIASLVADTRPDTDPVPLDGSPVAGESDEPPDEWPEDSVVAARADVAARTRPAEPRDYGVYADDLLPEPEKKGRRRK